MDLTDLNQFSTLLPLIVFVVVLLDSVPFMGLILPEELILTTAVIFAGSTINLVLIYLASAIAMFCGQTGIYLLSKKYGQKVITRFEIADSFVNRIADYLALASFVDQILIRLSSNSMFRITAACLTGINQVPLRQHLQYELVASTLKTAIFFAVGYLVSQNLDYSEAALEEILSRVGLAIFLVTIASLCLSYLIRKRLGNTSSA